MALRSSGACRAEKSGFVPWFIGKTTSCAAPPTWSWNTSKRTFDDPASLRKVLSGVQRAFLVTNSSEHVEERQLRFVALAREAGVKHIVYLSQLHAASDFPLRFLRYYAAVEAALRASGMSYTNLRPNLYMQGLLTGESPRPFRAFAHDYKSAFLDKKDMEQTQFKQGSGGSPRVHAGEGAL
jgi:hypothetical protein